MFQVRMAGVQSFFKFRRLTSRYRGTHQFTKVLATELQVGLHTHCGSSPIV